MKRHSGHTFRLDTTDEQAAKMAHFAGCVRYVYNRMLAIQCDQYEKTGKQDRYHALSKLLPVWKHESASAWLSDAPSQALQCAGRDLDAAWDRFFDPGLPEAQKPTFHKKRKHCSFRYPQGFKLDQKRQRVFLPKIGWVYYRKSLHLYGELRSVAVRRKNGRWFLSVSVATRSNVAVRRDLDRPIGADLGIACHTALSDGRQKKAPSTLRKLATKVAKLQSQRDRRQKKGSKRFAEMSRRIARLHEHIANIRKNHLHKLTTELAKNHGVVCIEDLRVKNMSKSAKGTRQAPGKHVSAKSGLNREILAQGWSEMRRQLQYKLDWRGGGLVVVPPPYTSQRCHACRIVDRQSRKTQSMFVCTACGVEIHADVNAAKNILDAGLAVVTRGESAIEVDPRKRKNSEPRPAA